MSLRLAVAAASVALSMTGCSTPRNATESDGAWVGTITTEGNVTTVVNESGSVWGGAARLVEEASIGVENGEPAYMLGSIGGLWATDSEIYLIDSQLPAVRVYDHEGRHLRDVGQPGQGPGEYVRPWRLAVGGDGRVFVSEARAQRINVYAAGGAPLDTWQTANMTSMTSGSLHIDDAGVLWYPMATALNPEELLQGVQALVDGVPGERAVIETFAGESLAPDPAVARVTWATYGPGALIVGRPETQSYRFELQRFGETVLAVERRWEPAAVDPDYATWYRAAYGDDLPDHYQPFITFTPAAPDEIWVTRAGPADRVPECDEDLSNAEALRLNPCWRPNYLVDVFGDDGRYRGEIDVPGDLVPVPQWMHAEQDLLIARSEDDEGILRVKRYRILRPGSG